jgi:hypothetical protein
MRVRAEGEAGAGGRDARLRQDRVSGDAGEQRGRGLLAEARIPRGTALLERPQTD